MKVAQIIPCLGGYSGGPSRSVYELARGLRQISVESYILANNYQDNPNIASDEWIQTINLKTKPFFEYSHRFKNLINKSEYDLLHIHSIYSYPVSIAARIAKQKHTPYVIAPRGSLYESAQKNSFFSFIIKTIFNELILYSDLEHASAIQATCEEEKKQIRRLGVKAPIAVIPNAISIPSVMPTISNPSRFRLCFLGRINPIKNIDGLLRAWHSAGFHNQDDSELVIIGDATLGKEQQYLKALHELERDLRIKNVSWLGAIMGSKKTALLNDCSYLILPSHSENFGMVVLEALIQGVPVVASRETPWSDLNDFNCGWWINNSVEEMGKTIRELYKLSTKDRMQMGINGQLYVKDHFSIDAISVMIKRLYEWILYGGAKPSFVDIK